MYQLAKTMALFWTLAEGIIFLYLRWGYLKLRGSESNQRVYVILCSATFCVLALWLFTGETLANRYLSDIRHIKLYRWGTWNFFCTLWVGLEGVIMIYVIRIYRLLRSKAAGKPGRTAVTIMWPLFFLFALYHLAFFETALNQAMTTIEIYNVSVFYIRICGLFWITFEWVVAVYGLKTYGLMKQGAKTAHANH